jgi:hypothetical protein
MAAKEVWEIMKNMTLGKLSIPGLNAFFEKYPHIDINSLHPPGTLLHEACHYGRSTVVKKLLDNYPNIRVDIKDQSNRDCFYVACSGGLYYILKLLLNKSTNVSESKEINTNPLWIAAQHGHLNCIMLLAACQLSPWSVEKAIDIAGYNNYHASVRYLKSYRDNKLIAVFRARSEMNVLMEREATKYFLFIVMLCDDYYKLCYKKGSEKFHKFLSIASKLPMEIQMIICNRAINQEEDFINASITNHVFVEIAEYEKTRE